MITKLSQLIEQARQVPKKRLAVAYADDGHTVDSVYMAVKAGIVEATLVGDEAVIREICRRNNIPTESFAIVNEPSETAAAAYAVARASRGEADILMKGSISTDKYVRALLSKETPVLPPKSVLTHMVVLEIPAYHKLLIATDVAIIPSPDIQQKVLMAKWVIRTAQSLGIETPKVAIVGPTEQMLPNIASCVDAATIAKMADRGQIADALVDGPLAVDVAIDAESARIKKLKSPVAGDADGLVFPDLDAANAFFKASTKLAGATLAGLVVGAKIPCVLTSRGDSEDSKLNSIALAVLVAHNGNKR
ncbi:MAG: phosphate butyryltransferase [Rikenellaceae bacterium]|jgi:phosphate butyryltransferase|nr:phosphate butyryltransferase [Rikenellaceae bacterium]